MAGTESTFLNWTDSESVVRRIELTMDVTTIGRRTDSDIVVFDMETSRRHARVLRDGAAFVVEDLGSRHGTFVNGARVERKELRTGDTFTVGRNRFELQLADTGQGAAEPEPDFDKTVRITNMFRELADSEAAATQDGGLDKISLLLDFQYHWKQSFPAEALFQHVLESAIRISGAERGYILRRTTDSFEYQLGLNEAKKRLSEDRFQTSRTVVGRVAESGEPVFQTEGLSADLAAQESIVQQNLRAVACLPLIGMGADAKQSEVLGILYLDSHRTMHGLSGLDERILTKLANEAGNVLEKMEMVRGVEERERMTKELALARETQRSLLPRSTPEVVGYEIRAFSHPTRYVGGDFYDFFGAGDATHFVLADVSGKGVAASLLSSSLQGALHMQFLADEKPEHALAAVNEYMCGRTEDDRFATLAFATLQPDGEGVYLSAGHIPSYLYRSRTRSVEEIASHDLLLGMFEEARYSAQRFRLDPGDLFLLLSDGLTEAVAPSGEMFGESRLIDLLRRRAPGGAAAVESAIMDALHAFTGDRDQADDITAVVIGRQRRDGERPRTLV